MLFNSLQFFIFFPLVVAGYFFLIPPSWRWAWLLLASCMFYMAFVPEYILILGITIVVDYWAGLRIDRASGFEKKFYLWLSVVITCGILFFFKYLDFVWQTGNLIREWVGVSVTADDRQSFGFALPIGLSFHTFQSLSYVIEVYRGRQLPERHFGVYALYVLFFPQLVAGPIERPQNLLNQFRGVHKFIPDRVASGLFLMAWGLFQKTVVADRLGIVVDYVYSTPKNASPDAALIATVFFAFQIFADFQGYSNVARGAARVLGFELVRNFNRPYAADSVRDFWRRWHMSLSTWFRDYVYLPLGGSHRGPLRNSFNLMATFLISGLWHGANWTFVIWGGVNGLYLVLGQWVKAPQKLWRPLRILGTFILILFSWTFFRASSVKDALSIAATLPKGFVALVENFVSAEFFTQDFMRNYGIDGKNFLLAIASLLLMEIAMLFEKKTDLGVEIRKINRVWRWLTYVLILVVLIFSWVYFPENPKPFIYFQF